MVTQGGQFAFSRCVSESLRQWGPCTSHTIPPFSVRRFEQKRKLSHMTWRGEKIGIKLAFDITGELIFESEDIGMGCDETVS